MNGLFIRDFFINLDVVFVMRSYLLFLCIFLLHTACSHENEEDLVVFTLSDTIISFDHEAQSCDINVMTNVDWNVINSLFLPEWLSVDKVSHKILRVNVKENQTDDLRQSRVFFDVAKDSCFLDIVQEPRKYLTFKGEKEYQIQSRKGTVTIEVESNVLFKIEISGNDDGWVTSSSNLTSPFLFNQTLILDIGKNTKEELRRALVVVKNDVYQLSDTLTIEQLPRNYVGLSDGECKILDKSLKASTNLVVLGDGFTIEDLENGYYIDSMEKAREYFFSIEPYKTYREYFNVYMVVAESEEEGVGEKGFFGKGSINNKFGTAFGDGTEIICNDELIFEYARKVKELPKDKPITVLVVLNSDKYAGTAYLYQDGNSIALCPMSTAEPPNDFEGIVHHEAGGHAFGFLVDEYVYNQAEMPESRKKEIQEWQKQGYQMNLDFTDDLDKILWKDFIGIDKYAPVGAYEGGYEYQYGVWRSEENSCMNNNIPYYNVQSRWSIVKRIMDLSEIEFSVQDFIKNDYPEYPKDSRALNAWENFVPLGAPVWVTK